MIERSFINHKILKKDKDYSKIRIAEAALSLFVKFGYDKTSIRLIANKADISLGLMYNYFESKEALLQYIINEGFKEVKAAFEMPDQQLPPSRILSSVVEATFATIQQHRRFWRLYYSLRMQPSVLQQLTVDSGEWQGLLNDQLIHYYRARNDDDPMESALILAAVIDGIAQHYVLAPSSFPIKRAIDTLINSFERESGGMGE